MASSSKKRTTMAKLAREHKLRERRVEKQARKEARRDAATDPPSDDDQLGAERPDHDPLASEAPGTVET